MWSSDSDSEDEHVIRIRRPRTFRVRTNYHFETQYEFNERFRLSSVKLEYLVNNLGATLQHATNRNQALLPSQQIQIALHWLGTGSQYHAVGDMHGVSKATVCRAVHNVVEAINDILLPQLVRWPDNILDVVQEFSRIGRLPMVIGVVDGTLIPISAPTENEPAYVDRYGQHSINVMGICGPNSKFYYVNANWPGSVHDSRVLRNSRLYNDMEAGLRPLANGIILGDSAYPLKDWLIPPRVINPNDNAEIIFLRQHKQTRRVIEQAFGIAKEKFPCLNFLRLNPIMAANVIKSCMALCNLSREVGDLANLVQEYNINNEHDDEINPGNNEEDENIIRGRNRLQQIINHFR